MHMGRSPFLLLLGICAFSSALFSKTGEKLFSKDFPIPSVSGPPASNVAGGFQQRMYKAANGDSLRYLLFLPEDYNHKKSYPSVLWLHGKSARGDNLSVLVAWGDEYGPLFFARPENQKNYPCFIVA